MSVVGFQTHILTRGDVEKNTIAHVENWFVTYLAKVERDQGLAPRTLPQPKAWEVVNEFQRYPEDRLPFIAVVSPGTSPGRRPMIDGDGLVKAWWSVAVGGIISAKDMRSAKDAAGFYGAAIRGLMLQLPQLGGWASGVEWTDEAYDDFPRVQERTIAACRLVFTVEVQDVMDIYDGPYGPPAALGTTPTPPGDPYADPGAQPVIQIPSTTLEINT